MNQNNDLRATRLPWLQHSNQQLPPDAFASTILCERHNNCLSGLDAKAVRLFHAFDEGGASGSNQRLLYLFNGHDLERWLLKILCGMIASKSFDLRSEIDSSIPEYWLGILFGGIDFPDQQSLYVCKSIGHRFEGPHGLQFQALTGSERITGIRVWLCSYEFILSMSGLPSRTFDGREFAFRPFEFYTTGLNFEKSVVFSWDGAADLGTISIDISNP